MARFTRSFLSRARVVHDMARAAAMEQIKEEHAAEIKALEHKYLGTLPGDVPSGGTAAAVEENK